MFGFRDLDFGHPVLTSAVRPKHGQLAKFPMTGSNNDFRSSFPNKKLRPGRPFTVKVFSEMIPVNSSSGTNNSQPNSSKYFFQFLASKSTSHPKTMTCPDRRRLSTCGTNRRPLICLVSLFLSFRHPHCNYEWTFWLQLNRY